MREFFGNRCCYWGIEFSPTTPAVQDHLIPMNKADLGLHAWGNIVPACQTCNATKQGKARVRMFLDEYDYKPTVQLEGIAEELYEDVGSIAMTLIAAKIKRVRAKLAP